MKRFVLAILVVVLPSTGICFEQTLRRQPLALERCIEKLPVGLPQHSGLQLVCRRGYLTAFDPLAKIPRWVAWTINPRTNAGCAARSNLFLVDPVVRASSTPADYSLSRYDRGHMSPAADNAWDKVAELESFYMSNMAPQTPALNRGVWSQLEAATRAWARTANLKVIAGTIYTPDSKKIGTGVVVPEFYYKIVYNSDKNQVAAWLFPNAAVVPQTFAAYRASTQAITELSKQQFYMPPGTSELAQSENWRVDSVVFQQEKSAKCELEKAKN